MIPEEVQFPCQQNVLNNKLPSELLWFFWCDEINEMFVTYSNLYAGSKNKVRNITKQIKMFLLNEFVPVSSSRRFCENSVHSFNNFVSDRFEYIFRRQICKNLTSDSKKEYIFSRIRSLVKTGALCWVLWQQAIHKR